MKTCFHQKRDTEATDRQLLDRIARADRDALATLYTSYHARLCTFLYRLTRRTDLIDEVIDECFWIVWQEASRFRQSSPVSNWIMGIAFRLGQKAMRRRGAQHVSDQRLVLELIYGDGHTPGDVATITGVSLRTVKARLLSARANLRKVLPDFTGDIPPCPCYAEH